jgi:Sec-independent protein translocase protein TatA
MEWLILRIHRFHVEKLEPVTSDVSKWIKAFRAYSDSNKEIRAMIKQHKEEGRRFDEILERVKKEIDAIRAMEEAR